MKKLATLLLTAAMLIPSVLGVIPAVSAESTTEVEKKPFYLNNFGTFGGVEGVDNIYGLPQFWSPSTNASGGLTVQVLGTYDIKEGAQKLKDLFDTWPDGARYFNFSNTQAIFKPTAEDVVYLDTAAQVCEDWLRKFLTEYKAIGGKLDGFVLDTEYFTPYAWFMYQQVTTQGQPDIYRRIVEDPRYETKLRPLLVERGFPFYPANDDPNKSEIYTICQASGSPNYGLAYHIWNQVMRTWINDYVNDYIYKVLIEIFPDANCCDYQSRDYTGWSKVTEWDGSNMYIGGNQNHVGNSSNYNTYSYKPIFQRGYGPGVNYNKPVGHDHAIYDETPFGMTQWDAYVFKNAYAANEEKKLSAWIGHYAYGSELDANPSSGTYYKNSNSCTPYYAEAIMHICMLAPEPLLGFVVGSEFGKMPEPIAENTILAYQIISDILHEMTRIVGAADRKPIETPATLDAGYILSGMYAGGKNYWRLTPDDNYVSLENFLVSDGGNPTFKVKGSTITFPGGKIIETGSVREVGTYGYWIETEVGVEPVITVDADRYEQFPAFVENFERYADITFTAESAYNQFCWTVTGDELTVRTQTGGNKALAMTGTSQLESVKVPTYVTAGDTYANQQAWSVNIQLPGGMPADAEVKALYANGSNGGFMIKGGKVYYNNNGTYQEMTGVTISAAKMYTYRREVDLTARTSSYYVYDSKGKEIGKVENVPMIDVVIPVTKIGISVSNVGRKLVYIDDFTIRLQSLNVTFEVYNANTGIQVADIAAAQTERTAYRLSWTNASAEGKKVAVMADFYDASGNKVAQKTIREVNMVPGGDGLETGIVDHEYHSVKVYLAENSENNDCTVDVTSGTADKNLAKPGDTITITAEAAPAGMEFDRWVVDNFSANAVLADPFNPTTTFTMPNGSVGVTATYKEKTMYTVSFTNNACLCAWSDKFKAGTTVTLTAKTHEGYVFEGWTSEDVTIENPTATEITFVMPAKNVTLFATYKVAEPEPTDPSTPTDPTTAPTQPTTPGQSGGEDDGGSNLPIILAVVAVVIVGAVVVVVVLKKKKA